MSLCATRKYHRPVWEKMAGFGCKLLENFIIWNWNIANLLFRNHIAQHTTITMVKINAQMQDFQIVWDFQKNRRVAATRWPNTTLRQKWSKDCYKKINTKRSEFLYAVPNPWLMVFRMLLATRVKWFTPESSDKKFKIMDLILWNIKIDFILTNKAFEGLC